MGMLGVDAAEAALELPTLDLQAGGQGGSYEIGFLQLRPAFRDGDVGVKVKIRVDRREDEQFRGFEGEPLVDAHGNVREPGDRSRIQFLLTQVRTVKERIDDQREVRIRHRGSAEDAGQFGGRTLLRRGGGLRGFTGRRTCGCPGCAWSARSAERGGFEFVDETLLLLDFLLLCLGGIFQCLQTGLDVLSERRRRQRQYQGWYEHESAPYLHGSSGMCGCFRKKEGQPAPSGVGGEEITETTRDELLVGRGRADVRDSERSGRRGLFLGKLETIRDYGKNMSDRHIGIKGSGLRLMQHDAERAIVVGVSIFVMMEFQPEGEGRQQQDEGEGKPLCAAAYPGSLRTCQVEDPFPWTGRSGTRKVSSIFSVMVSWLRLLTGCRCLPFQNSVSYYITLPNHGAAKTAILRKM